MFSDLLIFSFILWLMFIPVANVYEKAKHWTGLKKAVSYGYLWLFITIDIIYNYIYGSILFLEPASKERATLTARLKHYLTTEPDSWRGKLSYFICARLIEPWDQGHCALSVETHG